MRAPRARSGATGAPRASAWGPGRSPVQEGGLRRPGEKARPGARQCAPRGRGAGLPGPRERPRGDRGEAPSRKAGYADRARRPARARDNARPAGAERGYRGPASVRVGTGAKPRPGRRATPTGREGPPGRATMRAPRARSGATGAPRASAWGPGRSPVQEGGLRRQGEKARPGARQCAPRGRGAGLPGPRERPRGDRGEAPSRKTGYADRARRPARARDNARPAGAERGYRGPASVRVGTGAKPRPRRRATPTGREGPPGRATMRAPRASAWGPGRSPVQA